MTEHEQRLPGEPKVVQMPSREEMVQKLQEIGLYGTAPQTDAFFNNFVGQLAGSEKAGMALQMAWELATYDTMMSLPPVVRVVLNIGFNRVVDAVTPDPEVAEDAKAFRQQVLDEVKAQAGKKA
jgi:hypothetical protein